MTLRRSVHEMLADITRYNVPLAPFTTWGIGGSADRLIAVRCEDDLVAAARELNDEGLDFYILAGGSNLLIGDERIETPVILTTGMSGYEVSLHGDSVLVECEAGLGMKKLFALSVENGWSGLEFAAGLPGTVGGALMGNAGTPDGCIGDITAEVRALDSSGSRITRYEDELYWEYRRSPIARDRDIKVVTSVVLRLVKSTQSAVAARAKKNMDARKSQPLGAKTAGCVFKNPQGMSAGKLLDAVGCKGLSVGGAVVSHVHANIIENRGGATASDVLKLADICRERVMGRFGVTMRFEIKCMGIFPQASL